MFTGLIQATGQIQTITALPNGKRFNVLWPDMPSNIQLGESIAIDGCCMTVTEFSQNTFAVEASSETLALTLMQSYTEGQTVNFERALSLEDKLGGHFVTGHVDGLGQLIEKTPDGIAYRMTFKVSATAKEAILPCLIEKGAIAINGISLTINTVKDDTFSVAIIPFTYEHTNLKHLNEGELVNLEADMLGKYVNRHLSAVLSSTGFKIPPALANNLTV